MPTEPERVVVRRHEPRRTALVRGGLAVGALALLVGAFELGRVTAGRSTGDWFAERRAASRTADRVAELEAKLAESEIARRVDKEAYAQVEASLADLQSRLAEQSQELSFYRGILSPTDGSATLRVQRLLVMPGMEPHHYRLRIVLVQAGRQDAPVAGSLDVAVDGTRGGRPASLPLDEIARQSKSLGFSFRYFQEVETEVELPADFQPQRVQVEARPRNAAAPVRQTYPWKVETP